MSWREWAKTSARSVDVLEPLRGEQTLAALKVSAESTLGSIARETGGLLVADGWFRLLGGGAPRLPSLADWAGLGSAPIVEPVDRGLCVGFDAVGGFFVLLAQTQHVHSFLPDALDWQDTKLGYSEFVHWTMHGDVETFYGDLWRPGVELPPDEALSIHEATGATRPVTELWALYPGGRLRELLAARGSD